MISVLAYQEAPLAPLEHVAVWVSSAPQRTAVSDVQSCQLPETLRHPGLKPLALACFLHQDRPVPVLDVRYLACTELTALPEDVPLLEASDA